MATAALPRQSSSTRGAGNETPAAGKLCAATAPEPARKLPSSTVASGKPKRCRCTLSLVELELALRSALRLKRSNSHHPAGMVLAPLHFLGSGACIRCRFALIVERLRAVREQILRCEAEEIRDPAARTRNRASRVRMSLWEMRGQEFSPQSSVIECRGRKGLWAWLLLRPAGCGRPSNPA